MITAEKDLIGSFQINIEIARNEPVKTEIICEGNNAVVVPCAIIAIVEAFSAMDKTMKDHVSSDALIHELAKRFGCEVRKK